MKICLKILPVVSLVVVSTFSYGEESWDLVAHEDFNNPIDSSNYNWVEDLGGTSSPWYIDQFDNDGEAWHQMSDPQFSENLASMKIFRKQFQFGQNNWLTAELAVQDKDADGAPDSEPELSTVNLEGENALLINEPSWDSGLIIRPTQPLPERYRVEVTLRKLDFGGKRNGSFYYDGKYNGYADPENCKTTFPWTFQGSLENTERCDYNNVQEENGFYYLTILDHKNPSPQGNPGIHYRRKVIMDGYFSNASWSQKNAVCNPETGELYGVSDSTFNGVNAIFVMGDKFEESNNYVNTGYFFRTMCGDYLGKGPHGDQGQYSGIVTSAELQPELMPEETYTFAIERDETGYTIEMSGPFRFTQGKTIRFHHDFVEDGRPIWHYNQKPEEYDGRFNQSLEHSGYAGTYITENTWPQGSAYPDSFIIGDPHMNFYEGSAVIDDVKLFVPKSK